MGVNHLSGWSNKASSNKAPSGRSDAVQIRGLHNPAYTSPSTKVPSVPGVQRFANKSGVSHTGVSSPSQPPKHNSNGGRAGAKSGQPKVGGRAPRPGMPGGRLG